MLLDQQGHPERLAPPEQPEPRAFRVEPEQQAVKGQLVLQAQPEQPEPRVFRVEPEQPVQLE